MGGMEPSSDVLVALPRLPHFSHLYAVSRFSLLTNLFRASSTLRRLMLVGEDERELLIRVDDILGAAGFEGRMSRPMSSIGSTFLDVAPQAAQVTFDSTDTSGKEVGVSLHLMEVLSLGRTETHQYL